MCCRDLSDVTEPYLFLLTLKITLLIAVKYRSSRVMLAVVKMDAAELGTAHKSQLDLARFVFTGQHFRNGGAHGGQSRRNGYRSVDDSVLHTRLRCLHHVEEQAQMVPVRLDGDHDVLPAHAAGGGQEQNGPAVSGVTYRRWCALNKLLPSNTN